MNDLPKLPSVQPTAAPSRREMLIRQRLERPQPQPEGEQRRLAACCRGRKIAR